jgi:cephalosporin-C deacetylase
MPYVRSGQEQPFFLKLAVEANVDDGIRVSTSTSTVDHTFWTTNEPCVLTATCTNVSPKKTFKADLVLRLRNYLTGKVAHEDDTRIKLKGGASKELSWTLKDLPPMLYMAEIWVERGESKGLCVSTRIVYDASKILPPEVPEDFDAFWKQTLAEQKAIPLDLKIRKVKDKGEHEVYKFNFAGLLGHRCYGWLTLPKDKSKKWPGVLVLPPAGMRSQPIPIFNGTVGMRININTVDVDLPADQYDWRTWPSPYLVTGILEKEHYSLRFSYAALVRAAEVLAARPEVDPKQVRVQGSSQGGGLTIIAAGLYPNFTSATARKPGLCRLDWNLDYLQPPYFPIAAPRNGKQMIHNTLKYYLPSHFARRITCPIDISLGIYDDVTPGVSVFCAYNAIPKSTQKKLTVDPKGGH